MLRRCSLLVCIACLALVAVPAWAQVAQSPTDAGKTPVAVDLYGDPLPAGAVARLGTVRFRRATPYSLLGVAFLPDKKTVLTASEHELEFWDIASGRLLREVRTAPFSIGSFQISPDGKRAALAGARDGQKSAEIRVIDIASGKTLQMLVRTDAGEHEPKLAFSPNGKLLFSLGIRGLLRIEDIASGEKLLQREFPRDYVEALAVSSDGEHVAIASGRFAHKLFLWKWQKEEPRHLTTPDAIAGLRFSPDGELLAAVSERGERLYVWDVSTRRLAYQRKSPEDNYYVSREVAFTPDGKTLLVSLQRRHLYGRGKTELLNPANGQSKGVLPTDLFYAAVSPDSKLLAGAWGQALRLWDLTAQRELTANDAAHSAEVFRIGVSARGFLVTAADDSTLRVWDPATGKQRRHQRFDSALAEVALSPNGELVVVAGADDTVRLFAADSGREIYRLPGHGPYGGRYTLAFLPDGRSFLSFGHDYYLRRWDVKTGRALFEHAIRPSGVHIPDPDSADPVEIRLRASRTYESAAVAPDGKTFLLEIAGDYRFFDTAGGKETRRITPSGHADSVAISPNGKYFLTSSWGREVENTHDIFLREWDSGEAIRITLPGPMAGPVAFSADSRSFAAASTGPNALHVFETASGKERHRTDGFRGRVRSLAFFPDGRRLASGHGDSTVLIWDLTALRKE